MNIPGCGDERGLALSHNFGLDSYDVGSGYGHIETATSELDGRLAELGGHCLEPEKPPYCLREDGSRLCLVRGPDGYRIELIERG